MKKYNFAKFVNNIFVDALNCYVIFETHKPTQDIEINLYSLDSYVIAVGS